MWNLTGCDDSLFCPASDPEIELPAPEPDPYRQLWAEVLRVAVVDATSTPRKSYYCSSLTVREARAWIFQGRPGRLNFSEVCAVLDLDPGRVRMEVKRQIDGKTVATPGRGRPRFLGA